MLTQCVTEVNDVNKQVRCISHVTESTVSSYDRRQQRNAAGIITSSVHNFTEREQIPTNCDELVETGATGRSSYSAERLWMAVLWAARLRWDNDQPATKTSLSDHFERRFHTWSGRSSPGSPLAAHKVNDLRRNCAITHDLYTLSLRLRKRRTPCYLNATIKSLNGTSYCPESPRENRSARDVYHSLGTCGQGSLTYRHTSAP